MELKNKIIKNKHRLYGCHFTEKEYQFINQKIKEINKDNEKKMSNTEIILKLFKFILKEDENSGENK